MDLGSFLELDKEQDKELKQYQFSRPPPKSYLDPPASTPPPPPPLGANGVLGHHANNSFDTTRTNGSLSSYSFGTSESGYRSSFRPNRSRSSTLMTAHTAPPTTLAPTPVPRKNTFVDELASSQLEVIPGAKCEKIDLQVSPTTQTHNQYHDQYPAPWRRKKKDSVWSWFKRWKVHEELDFAARYEIWVNRKGGKWILPAHTGLRTVVTQPSVLSSWFRFSKGTRKSLNWQSQIDYTWECSSQMREFIFAWQNYLHVWHSCMSVLT